ncbi:MAG: oligosaccharide flippase family protein [Bacteroidota bacterium]|nr:oligosaccharide flippase family protein [Bacteroidota bacterium]
MLNFLKKRLDTQSKTLFKNSSWVFFANIIGSGLTFIRGIVIARGLGAELFGVYTVLVAFINTVMELLNLNLMTPIIKFGSQYKSAKRPDKLVALIKSSMIATLAIGIASVLVITVLTYTSYDVFIKTPGLEWFAIAYSIVAGFLLFNHINRGVLRLYFKFKLNSIVQIIMDVAELLLVTLALFIYPNELKYFLIAILTSRFINFIIPAIAAYRELLPEFRSHLQASVSLIREDFKSIRIFTLNNSFARTVQSLINNGDVLIIGVLASSPAQAGYYAVGKKLAWAILTLFDPLTNSIYPQLCKLIDEGQVKGISKMLIKMTGIAAVPATLFIIIAFFFNEIIITTVFGKDFLEASSTFALLTVASLLYSLFFWMQPLLQALNMTGLRLRVSLIGLITGIAAAYFLIPTYGADGMAVTMIIMNVVMPAIFLYFVVNKMKSEILKNS